MNNTAKIPTKMIVLWSFVILTLGLVINAINYNNKMIKNNEIITNTLESTKVEYSQCLIKIGEQNSIAKAYKNDLIEISWKAWENLNWFSNQMMTWFNTKILPEVSPDLRKNVQMEIRSCRNSYTSKIDLELKPLFTTFNTLQKTFPWSLYNMFFDWEIREFVMPKTEKVTEIFETWIDKELDLD